MIQIVELVIYAGSFLLAMDRFLDVWTSKQQAQE